MIPEVGAILRLWYKGISAYMISDHTKVDFKEVLRVIEQNNARDQFGKNKEEKLK